MNTKPKDPAIIIDIDGTLANCEHRRHWVENKPKQWDKFFEEMDKDDLNSWCDEIIDAFKGNFKILLVTGRSQKYAEKTLDWLRKWGVHYDRLIMRAEDDFRLDTIVKREIYEEQIKDNFDVLFTVDDRSSVVNMWRELGLTCLQCDKGDF